MKIGTLSQSLKEPISGFSLRREGFSIYVRYIPETSITTIFIPDDSGVSGNELPGHTEYQYTEYSLYKSMSSLISFLNCSKLIFSNFLITSSNKKTMISNEAVDDYNEYRAYVTQCKEAARASYEGLGLIKKGD